MVEEFLERELTNLVRGSSTEMSEKRRTITAETATMSLAMTNPEIRQSSGYGPAPEQGLTHVRSRPGQTVWR